MAPLFIDYETFWSTEFSLGKMPVDQYVKHEQFKAHMVGAAEGAGDPYVIPYEDIPRWHKDVKYDQRLVIAHNARFDLSVSAFQYGALPKACGDTLSMSYWANGRRIPSHSLKNLAEHYNLRAKKIEGVLGNTKGVRDLTPDEYAKMAVYCQQDVEVLRMLYVVLHTQMRGNRYALSLIDWTIRQAIDPILELDGSALLTAYQEEAQRKENLVAASGVPRTTLASGPKFKAHLRDQYGIDLGRRSLSKDGLAVAALLANAATRQITQTRLAISSSINETRLQRMADAARRGPWPVMLNFCGAMNTGRFSGGERYNQQNLVKGTAQRSAIRAPSGHVLVISDSNKVELVISMCLARQNDMVDAMRRGGNPYCLMAERIFGYKVGKATHPNEYAFGKMVMLALGYGMGLTTFQARCNAEGVTLPDHLVASAHRTYRQSMYAIANAWKACDRILQAMLAGQDRDSLFPANPELLSVRGDSIVVNHTGFEIKYPGLHRRMGDFYVNTYTKSGTPTTATVFNARVWENIIQCLANTMVCEQLLTIQTRYRAVLQEHDEIVAVVPEAEAEEAHDFIYETMSTPPDWWPDLPIGAETITCDNYGGTPCLRKTG